MLLGYVSKKGRGGSRTLVHRFCKPSHCRSGTRPSTEREGVEPSCPFGRLFSKEVEYHSPHRSNFYGQGESRTLRALRPSPLPTESACRCQPVQKRNARESNSRPRGLHRVQAEVGTLPAAFQIGWWRNRTPSLSASSVFETDWAPCPAPSKYPRVESHHRFRLMRATFSC